MKTRKEIVYTTPIFIRKAPKNSNQSQKINEANSISTVYSQIQKSYSGERRSTLGSLISPLPVYKKVSKKPLKSSTGSIKAQKPRNSVKVKATIETLSSNVGNSDSSISSMSDISLGSHNNSSSMLELSSFNRKNSLRCSKISTASFRPSFFRPKALSSKKSINSHKSQSIKNFKSMDSIRNHTDRKNGCVISNEEEFFTVFNI